MADDNAQEQLPGGDDEMSPEELAAFNEGFGEEMPEPTGRDGQLPESDEDLHDEVVDTFGDMTEDEEAAAVAAERGEEPEPDPQQARLDAHRKAAEGKGDEPGGGDDPDAELTPEQLRAQNQELSQRLRKMEGRYGDLNRQMQDFMKAGGTAARKAAGEGAATPSSDEVQAAITNSDKMKALKEEYPEFGAALEETLGIMAKSLPNLDAFQQQIEQAVGTQVGQATGEIYDTIISERHENWVETINTPEYEAWIANQPEDIQALEKSRKVTDVIKLLDHFEGFRGWLAEQGDDVQKYRPEVQLDLYANRDVDSGSTPRNEARRTSQNRRSRLESAVPATVRGGRGSRGQAVMTEEQAFEAGYNGE